jgi:ring-1,2-phenylacetyl-CoA epoxidase subunit PaaC
VSAAAPALGVEAREALAELLLSLADDEFVIGFWDSEWTGIAPMLEEDVATSSIAQDELGHAKALYELLANLTDSDADRIAFGRPSDAFRHASLLNHDRGDWAFSVARRHLYETADAVRLEALATSSHEPLAQLAAKMRREEAYHRLHVDAWLDRLAADEHARGRLAAAIRTLWSDAQDLFAPLAGEPTLAEAGLLPGSMAELHARWVELERPRLEPISGSLPDHAPRADGRRRRTDAFRWLHGEFTMVAGSEEGATW